MQQTKRQMLIGGTMLVLGWLVVFAIVLGLIPAHIWLSMAAYSATLIGFMIGIVGVVSHIRTNLRDQRN